MQNQRAGKQEKVAAQGLVYIILSLVVAYIVMLLPLSQIAANISRRPHPLVPPSHSLLDLFAAAGLLFLLGSVLWLRRQVGQPLSLPAQEFQRQVFISIALADANLYLGFFWVVRGGAFLWSLPFFLGPALVALLCVLPVASQRARLLKQRSGNLQ